MPTIVGCTFLLPALFFCFLLSKISPPNKEVLAMNSVISSPFDSPVYGLIYRMLVNAKHASLWVWRINAYSLKGERSTLFFYFKNCQIWPVMNTVYLSRSSSSGGVLKAMLLSQPDSSPGYFYGWCHTSLHSLFGLTATITSQKFWWSCTDSTQRLSLQLRCAIV